MWRERDVGRARGGHSGAPWRGARDDQEAGGRRDNNAAPPQPPPPPARNRGGADGEDERKRKERGRKERGRDGGGGGGKASRKTSPSGAGTERPQHARTPDPRSDKPATVAGGSNGNGRERPGTPSGTAAAPFSSSPKPGTPSSSSTSAGAAGGSAKKELSKSLLNMKFMQRAQDKEFREQLEKEQKKFITAAHWTLDAEGGNAANIGKP
ncbi:MAG: hypothetical protein BJ554DRAFT_6074 [Olpidium bornovanus]|uniref:Uncharacterized protein n=1 Tax=Olpidium bornovanus TaxID=278681 RepID=A0A8H7ZYJ8_9FUNG|nr:MAG: hypothetical protein BJ554DRAFT_6074 [Olpidium bornovanus]